MCEPHDHDTADAEDGVERYASAYSAEDVVALGALLAPSFERQNADDPAEDKSQAPESYARQFAQLTDPVYSLSDLSIATAAKRASIEGRYRIASAAGTVGGSIEFALAEYSGELLITAIVTVPHRASPETSGGREPSESDSGKEGSTGRSTPRRPGPRPGGRPAQPMPSSTSRPSTRRPD